MLAAPIAKLMVMSPAHLPFDKMCLKFMWGMLTTAQTG
jgi:hypothetical protein